MYQLTVTEVTYPDYPSQYFSSPSTKLEGIDAIYIWDNALSNWTRKQHKKPFYHTIVHLLKTDLSSIWPHFEIKNETSMFEEELMKKEHPDDMLEFDIIVRIPPIKEGSARLRVKSVKKAVPHIVEPVGL